MNRKIFGSNGSRSTHLTMEPSVPWQYAYNRLAANVQGVVSGELHQHFAAQQAAGNNTMAAHIPSIPSTTSQLLLQAANTSGHIWTPSANYENAFAPLFSNPKVAHLNSINAQLLAQAALNKQVVDTGNFATNHQPFIGSGGVNPYFDQSTNTVSQVGLPWQSNNQQPTQFGVLPHENNVSSSPSLSITKSSMKSTPTTQNCNGFNSNEKSQGIMASQPQNPVNLNKTELSRAQSGSHYASGASNLNNANVQANYDSRNKQHSYGQSDIKNYSVGQNSTSSLNMSGNNIAKNSPNAYKNSNNVVIKSEPCQRSPGSDRKPETKTQSTADQLNSQHNALSLAYRQHFLGMSNANAVDTSQYNISQNLQQNNNSGDAIVVPSRPSPLQHNSQASPLGHVPSPAYQSYNSPMSSISSPQDQQKLNEQPAQRPSNQINNYKLDAHKSPFDNVTPSQQAVAYSSVIKRVIDRLDPGLNNNGQHQPNAWLNDFQRNQLQQKNQSNLYNGIQETAPVMATHQDSHQNLPSNHNQRPYDSSSNNSMTFQDISNYRPSDSANIQHESTSMTSSKATAAASPATTASEEKVIGSRKRKSKPVTKNAINTNALAAPSDPSTSSGNNYANRVPPPAHANQHVQFSADNNQNDYDRWNAQNYPPPKIPCGPQPAGQSPQDKHQLSNQNDSTTVKNALTQFLSYHHNNTLPITPSANYFPQSYQTPTTNNDFIELTPVPATSSANMNPMSLIHQSIPQNSTTLSNSFTDIPEIQNIYHKDNKTNHPTTATALSGIRQDEHPNVIVPNIEDELSFLDDSTTDRGSKSNVIHPTSTQISNNAVVNHHSKQPVPFNQNNFSNAPVANATTAPSTKTPFNLNPKAPSAGYMSSYLRFLQDERDTSPPLLANRGARRNGNGHWTKPAVKKIIAGPSDGSGADNIKAEVSFR